MLEIQKKIHSFTDGGRLLKKKYYVLLYIYDDILLLQKQGLKLPGILEIINANDFNFSLTAETFYTYIKRAKKFKEEEPVNLNVELNDVIHVTTIPPASVPAHQSVKYSLDEWKQKTGVYNKILIANLEEKGISPEEVKKWGCYGNYEVNNKLVDFLYSQSKNRKI